MQILITLYQVVKTLQASSRTPAFRRIMLFLRSTYKCTPEDESNFAAYDSKKLKKKIRLFSVNTVLHF